MHAPCDRLQYSMSPLAQAHTLHARIREQRLSTEPSREQTRMHRRKRGQQVPNAVCQPTRDTQLQKRTRTMHQEASGYYVEPQNLQQNLQWNLQQNLQRTAFPSHAT
ncbi:hypothetical protein EYF80_024742 [Liparis tanakae]|uniref:Uncharacterized protein n=1 Tax=Liparis tanakae TaxID=230148 RepID=A0A4Z2HJ84_9TELE|nr:hypothetical protein EYF80_024742 [Liparis tanakae]